MMLKQDDVSVTGKLCALQSNSFWSDRHELYLIKGMREDTLLKYLLFT